VGVLEGRPFKRLIALALGLVAIFAVSSCAVGQVTSIDDVGPLGADVHGTAATSDPASLELMLVAKAGGTPTPADNDIVSPTNQNRWSQAASGCLSVTPAAGSSFAYVANFLANNVSQYNLGTGGLLAPLSPATVAAGFGPFAVTVSPDGGSVYVTNESDHTVSQYDVGAGGALSPKTPVTVAAGTDPIGVAISPPRKFDVTAELGTSETHQCLTQDYTLLPDTEYNVRLCARDASHAGWNCGGNRSFTTDPAL
jgi:hypothetical protein